MKHKLLLSFASLLLLSSIGSAQISNIYNFTTSNTPQGSLTAVGNVFYGMTEDGGANNEGCIFSINKNGTGYKDIWDFYDSGSSAANGSGSLPFNANGNNPLGSVIVSGSTIYGMTEYGGYNGYGVVFSVSTNGTGYRDLWDFDGGGDTNGSYPYGSLILARNMLYGMTNDGGYNYFGNVFSVNINGGPTSYKELVDFGNSNTINGAFPDADLVISGKTLLGTTYGAYYYNTGKSLLRTLSGGPGYGNVFSVDTNGNNYKDIYVFGGPNGEFPEGNLTLSKNGTRIYGTTSQGGPKATGDPWDNNPDGYGIVFAMDTSGYNFKDLFDFNDTNGSEPEAAVTLSGDQLYGVTYSGGTFLNFGEGGGLGTLFSVDTLGKDFNVLFDFNTTNGQNSYTNLLSYGDSILGDTLYGMTSAGGFDEGGNIFRFVLPAHPKSTLGINTIVANPGQIVVYPNPNNGQFNIASKITEGAMVEVYNVMGQNVLSQTLQSFSNNSIDMSSASSGVYMYRVIATKGGDLLDEGKLVIQK